MVGGSVEVCEAVGGSVEVCEVVGGSVDVCEMTIIIKVLRKGPL